MQLSDHDLRFHLRTLRYRLRALLPWVGRRRMLTQTARLQARIQAIASQIYELDDCRAADTASRFLKPPGITAGGELCLFVSHCATPALKPHVSTHIEALLAGGIQVLLILNSDCFETAPELPAPLLARLAGCMIRTNRGFDFGAWAHAYSLLPGPQRLQRLYLINDSIVGPVDAAAHRALLERIRGMAADCIGLTCAQHPRPHLQSYFLVVNAALLRSTEWPRIMHGIRNLATKQQVIDCYETTLSGHLQARGFMCAAVFAGHAGCAEFDNATIHDWATLIRGGLPFIKGAVLQQLADSPLACELVPARLRQPFSHRPPAPH